MMGEDFFSTAGLEARGESRDRLPPPLPVLLRAKNQLKHFHPTVQVVLRS